MEYFLLKRGIKLQGGLGEIFIHLLVKEAFKKTMDTVKHPWLIRDEESVRARCGSENFLYASVI